MLQPGTLIDQRLARDRIAHQVRAGTGQGVAVPHEAADVECHVCPLRLVRNAIAERVSAVAPMIGFPYWSNCVVVFPPYPPAVFARFVNCVAYPSGAF